MTSWELMKPPPLAQWMMDALSIEFVTAIEEGAPIIFNPWLIREDHNDALLNLVGLDGRDADVWVEWPPRKNKHDDLNVIIGIVVGDGQPFIGTPQELAAWLKGAT